MGSPILKIVEKALDILFDINDAGHTMANVGILATGAKVTHVAEVALHVAVFVAFIGLIWRLGKWITRRRQPEGRKVETPQPEIEWLLDSRDEVEW